MEESQSKEVSDAAHHRASLSKHYILIAARFNNSVIESRSALCHKDRSHKLWQLKPVINIKVQIGRAVISAFNDWKWQGKATSKAFLIMQFMSLGTAHFLASSTGPNKMATMLYESTFRNASTVLEYPAVITTSFEWMCSRACAAMLLALQGGVGH